jgi:mono/diheme cytochrome c family protein
MMRRALQIGVAGVAMAALLAGGAYGQSPHGKADAANPAQVSRGERVYKRFCSLCHGGNLEGQANWRIRKDDGKLPAPPHDATGHTWHHPDTMLFGIVKYGLVPPYAPADYPSDMPAWGDTLRDDDIWAVLAYIKSRWPPDIRRIQQEANAQSASPKN